MSVTTATKSDRSQNNAIQTTNKNENHINELTVVNIAKECLGYGYDQLTNRKCNRALKDFSQEDIEIYGYQTFESSEIGFSETEVIDHLQRKIGLTINFQRIFNLNPSLNFNKTQKTTEKIGRLVYATTFLHTVRFGFKSTPQPREGVPPAFKGDSFINSGSIYAGYLILFDITYEKHSEKKENITSGGGGLNIFQNLFGISLNVGQEKELSKGRKITHITHQARCLGDYSIPLKFSNNYEHMIEDLGKIKNDFLAKLPNFKHLHYDIDPDSNLTGYDVFPELPLPILLPKLSPAGEDKSFSFSSKKALQNLLKSNIEYFSSLAQKLLNYKEAEKVVTEHIGDLQLTIMLQKIGQIFPHIFSEEMNAPRPEGYTIVVGDTGAGKSLLIGYLLGAKVKTEKKDKESDEVHFIYENNDEVLPRVSGGGSETLGCKTYERYIDTAGLDSTARKEEDICNAAAIHLVTKVCKPKRLILVIQPSDIIEKRNTALFKKVNLLQRIIKNFQNNFSAILFVVNDINTPPVYSEATANKLIVKFDNAITTLKKEQEKLLPNNTWTGMFAQYNPYNYFKSKESQEELQQQIKEKIKDPGLLKRCLEFQEEINILTKIKEGNLLVTDLLKDNTREKIKAWEEEQIKAAKGESKKPASDFIDMENYVQGAWKDFKNVLLVVSDYFLHLQKQKKSYHSSIEEIDLMVKELNDNIQKLQSSDESSRQEIIKQKNELIEKYCRQLPKEIKKLESKKETLENEITALKNDETPIFHSSLVPLRNGKPTAITPRSFFAFESIAWTYSFEFGNKEISLVKAEQSKSPGKFFVPDDTQLKQGKYSVKYLPKWYGCEEDSNASVKLFIAKKDTLVTKNSISNKEKEIKDEKNPENGLKGKIEAKKAERERILKEIKELNIKLVSSSSTGPLLEYYRIVLNGYLKQKNQKEAELQQIESEFKEHENFCFLLLKISEKMLQSTNSSMDDQEIEQLDLFLRNLSKSFGHHYDGIRSLKPNKKDKTNRKDLKQVHNIQHFGKGIKNNHNDCFMNASLQLIVNSPFIQFFSNENNLEGKNSEQEAKVYETLTEFFKGYKTPDTSFTYQFREVLGFEEETQEDAAEFLENLLRHYNITNICSELSKRRHVKGNLEELAAKGKISDEGMLLNQKGNNQSQLESTMILQIPIIDSHEPIQFKLVWQNFINSEQQGPAKFNYKGKCFEAHYNETITFESLHNHLLVQLKRFNNEGEKIETKIAINDVEDIAGKDYQLKGFILHMGNSLKDGHYVAYLEHNEFWQCFNDQEVIIVDKEEALEVAQEAYILCFVQTEKANKEEKILDI